MSGGGGSRRAARRAAVVLLYQHDLTGLGVEELRANARAAGDEEEDPHTASVVDGVLAAREDLDRRIDAAATGWSVERLGAVERAILRVASWEILHSGDVPGAVAVNEAVELAKRYCGTEAPAFVNGILARILAEAEGATP